MASFQVEIATNSSPFHNHRDSYNLNNLVSSCIANNDDDDDNSSTTHIDITDLWVHQPQWQTTTAAQNDQNKLKENCRKTPLSTTDSSLVVEGGVSSLVQKWKGFEAVAKSPNTTKNNSSQDHPDADDLFGDWESDRTAVSGPPSSRGRESDVTDSERRRVADIIKKLTEDRTSDPDSSPRESDQRPCIAALHIGLPRIRGRQAYNDLLMQMERDRRKELQGLASRHAVSKFSHRGRIQAFLRIRFMRRAGMEEAKQGRQSNTSASHKTKQSVIAHFREKVESSSIQNGKVQCASFHKKKTKDTPAAEPNMCAAAKQDGTGEQCQEDISSKSCPGASAGTLSTTFNSQETNLERNDSEINSVETVEFPLSSNETNMDNKESGVTNDQDIKSNVDLSSDCANPLGYQEGESDSYQNTVETDTYWVSDVSHPEVGWEEMQSDYEHQAGSKRDWMDEVSRPRSDWEDLRKARYEEMLDPFLDNDEIRTLLGRRSVSTFLSSGLRDKIDQVMMLRAEGCLSIKSNSRKEEKHDKLPEQEQSQAVAKREGEVNDMMDQQEEEDYGNYLDEYAASEGSMRQQYTESDDYTDHLTSSPPASWGHTQGQESSDYFVSPAQQSSTNFYSQNNGFNSSYCIRSFSDVELIHDLRRHMEQMHQEMSELRRAIKCCMDMQIKLQSSLKKQAAVALKHSDTKNGSMKKVRSGGRCRVCCKMQVDSLLYRCGHMCTCYECAHELESSSRKCPICNAAIVDVVRTHA